MRRRTLGASLLALALTLSAALTIETAAGAVRSNQSGAHLSAVHGGSDALAKKKPKKKAKKRKARKAKKVVTPGPAWFVRRTVRITRGTNQVTVSWPARLYATGYTVTWSPTWRNVPTSPTTCYYPCRKRWTAGTSMVLSSAAMTTYGRAISSASGNTVQLKIFAQNSVGMSWTGITYPWDAFIAPAWNTAVDWLPLSSSQMPLPLPARAGRAVTISSFNVLAAGAAGPTWASRVAKVVNQINGTGSSVVATQENSNVNMGVSGGVAQYNDLATRLRPTGWALADARNWDRAIRKPRWDSTQAVRIYYRTNTWKQVTNGALLTRAGFAGQTSGVRVDRWVSWTKLQSIASPSTKLCVLNAHLLANQPGHQQASAAHRNAEMAQIMSELNNANSGLRRVGTRVGAACARTPTVFAGDLNAAQEHPPYGNLPQATALASGFVDTKNAGRRYNTRLSGIGQLGRWHPGWGTQIDYLLIKGMGGARAFKLNTIAPSAAGSDHYPITAAVNVPPS